MLILYWIQTIEALYHHSITAGGSPPSFHLIINRYKEGGGDYPRPWTLHRVGYPAWPSAFSGNVGYVICFIFHKHTRDLMFAKYEADLLRQNMSHITTKGRGVRDPSPCLCKLWNPCTYVYYLCQYTLRVPRSQLDLNSLTFPEISAHFFPDFLWPHNTCMWRVEVKPRAELKHA